MSASEALVAVEADCSHPVDTSSCNDFDEGACSVSGEIVAQDGPCLRPPKAERTGSIKSHFFSISKDGGNDPELEANIERRSAKETAKWHSEKDVRVQTAATAIESTTSAGTVRQQRYAATLPISYHGKYSVDQSTELRVSCRHRNKVKAAQPPRQLLLADADTPTPAPPNHVEEEEGKVVQAEPKRPPGRPRGSGNKDHSRYKKVNHQHLRRTQCGPLPVQMAYF